MELVCYFEITNRNNSDSYKTLFAEVLTKEVLQTASQNKDNEIPYFWRITGDPRGTTEHQTDACNMAA